MEDCSTCHFHEVFVGNYYTTDSLGDGFAGAGTSLMYDMGIPLEQLAMDSSGGRDENLGGLVPLCWNYVREVNILVGLGVDRIDALEIRNTGTCHHYVMALGVAPLSDVDFDYVLHGRMSDDWGLNFRV